MLRKALIFLVTLTMAFAADASRAEAVRLPKTDDPAYTFELPPGWTTSFDKDNRWVTIVAADRSSLLLLGVIPYPAAGATPLADAAASFARTHNLPEYTRTGPGTIAGLPGDAFFTLKTNSNGVSVAYRVVVAKLDASHFAVQVSVNTLDITSAQSVALDILIAQVQFTGLSKEARQRQARSSASSIPMKKEGGIYVVPVQINSAITLKFVVDSGAADVSIPADVVMTLMRTGTLSESDFIGAQNYVLADGSAVPSMTFRIRSLKVGNKVVENVVGSVAPVKGSLLLGQSFLGRFKSWSIDNAAHALVVSGAPDQSQQQTAPPCVDRSKSECNPWERDWDHWSGTLAVGATLPGAGDAHREGREQ